MPEAFLQEATQAPQPMQAVRQKTSSSTSALDRNRVGVAEHCRYWRRYNRRRRPCIEGGTVDHQVLDDRECLGAPGFVVTVSPSGGAVELAGRGALQRSVCCTLMCIEHMPQMPSRQSWSNATGSFSSRMRRSFSTSINLERRGSPGMSAKFRRFHGQRWFF